MLVAVAKAYLKHGNEKAAWGSLGMIYFIVRLFSLALSKYFWCRFEGKENLPAKGPFILAANHSSYLDPLLLGASTNHFLHFIVRDKLLNFPVVGWVLKRCCTIPIKRHGNNIGAIKDAVRVLKKGNVLAMFPEGTRTKDRKLKRAKSGVGMIVSMAKAPVVPVYIKGTFDALPRRLRTLKRLPVQIHIGKPIDFSKKHDQKRGQELYQAISDEIMQHIAALKEKADKAP